MTHQRGFTRPLRAFYLGAVPASSRESSSPSREGTVYRLRMLRGHLVAPPISPYLVVLAAVETLPLACSTARDFPFAVPGPLGSRTSTPLNTIDYGGGRIMAPLSR